MACRQFSGFHKIQDLGRKGEKTQRICYSRARFADTFCGFFLRQPKIIYQRLVSSGFLDRIQVLPLQVFHKSKLSGCAVIRFQYSDGDFCKPSQTSGSPSPLSGYDLVIPGTLVTHGNRLKKTIARNGIGKRLQRLFFKNSSRLILPRLNSGERQCGHLIGTG